MPRFDKNDYGIIYYGSTTPGLTYVDYLGQTRDAVLLVDGTEIFMSAESSVVHAGNSTRFSLSCEVAVSGGESMELRLHGELTDSSVTQNSPVLQTVRNDDGTSDSVQTFTTGAMVMLQTDNLSSIVNAAVGITYTGAGGEGTQIVVRLRVA